MNSARKEILDWVEQGHLDPAVLPAALRLAQAIPDAARWRQFLDRLLLWSGTLLLAAAVIFFFAYNWQAMGRFAKFGLAEGLVLAALFGVWKFGLEGISGKAAMLMAALLTGALLALVGQTYQTGADTFELFSAWAVAILPWVLIGRFPALWLLWMGLINLACVLYYLTFGGLLGLLFSPEQLIWQLFGLNTVALLLWESASLRGVSWMQERWTSRVLVLASGGLITALALWAIFEFRKIGPVAFFVYVVWLVAAYAVYRTRIRDLFALAAGALSVIVVVASFLSKHLLARSDAGALLFIGLVVIGLSAAAGLWLRRIAMEAGHE